MNKHDLVSAVSGSAGISQADATRAIECIFDYMTASLRAGSEVRLAGFGTFSVSHRKATTGRNPRTGAPIQVAARNLAKFKAGKALKEAVN